MERKCNNEKEKSICSRYLKGELPSDLAKEFKVHRTTIQNIVKRNNIGLNHQVELLKIEQGKDMEN